jgi:hypothetical protein
MGKVQYRVPFYSCTCMCKNSADNRCCIVGHKSFTVRNNFDDGIYYEAVNTSEDALQNSIIAQFDVASLQCLLTKTVGR